MEIQLLRRAMRRSPFQPFTLRMRNGSEYYVPALGTLAVGRGIVIVVTDTDEITDFRPRQIASIHAGKPKKDIQKSKKSGGHS